MDNILKKDLQLTNYTLEKMKELKDIFIYGDAVDDDSKE